jgi:hypothetical protein
MINLLCVDYLFEKNKHYLFSLINMYSFFNLKFITKDEDIIEYIKKENIEYSNNIILNIINEDFLKKVNQLNNISYILNIEIINQNDNYSYLSKYKNIIIIDYSSINKFILEKYKFVHHLPYQVLDEQIHKNEKIYDIAITDLNSDTNKIIYISLKNYNININNIDDYDDNYEFLIQHKIIIINNENKNNGINIESLCEKCILNKVIIINNKSSFLFNNYLKKYIIDLQSNIIPSYINYLLENYYDIHNLLYKDFDINSYRKYMKNVGLSTIHSIISNNKYGFIIIRHVNSEKSDKYWIESYNCIRKYYNNKIIIIDDNSNQELLTNNINLINCEIIKSEYPYSGEILGYYYLHKYHLFDKAVIIHDSTFIQKYIDFFKYDNIKFIWHFLHKWDNTKEELKLINSIKYNNLNLHNNIINLYNNKNKWFGCFGLQSVIEYNFLNKLSEKYNIFNLLNIINNRKKRMNIERIFALLCCAEEEKLYMNPSIYGIIHDYIKWGYNYDQYMNDKYMNDSKLDIIKVWSGR